MACVSAPKKLMYQIPNKPKITGMFCSNGVFLKCSSLAWAPANNCLKLSNPMPKEIDKPIALHKE